MTPTPEDYAQKYIDAVIDGVVNTNKYQDVKKFIAGQIAAAVAAEHQQTKEQCAKVARDFSSKTIGTSRDVEIANAIRALP